MTWEKVRDEQNRRQRKQNKKNILGEKEKDCGSEHKAKCFVPLQVKFSQEHRNSLVPNRQQQELWTSAASFFVLCVVYIGRSGFPADSHVMFLSALFFFFSQQGQQSITGIEVMHSKFATI